MLLVVALVDLLLSGDVHSDVFYAAVDGAADADVAAVLHLADSGRADVRRDVALTLPLLSQGHAPSVQMVDVMVRLSTDPDRRVRDSACFALGQQWREVQDAAVLDALAARLDDVDRDARSEALVGLAYRRDPRALPRVRAALARLGTVWRLELVAAGALSDPDLHELVLRHRHGWNDPVGARTAEVVCRLTDPEGPGEDVVQGVAALYQRRARGVPDGDALAWWSLMDEMLDIAPHRAAEFLDRVLAVLVDDPSAMHEVRTRSGLAQLAASVE
jgi:HEAT repeat protein